MFLERRRFEYFAVVYMSVVTGCLPVKYTRLIRLNSLIKNSLISLKLLSLNPYIIKILKIIISRKKANKKKCFIGSHLFIVS